MSDWPELEDFYGDSLTADQARALKRSKTSDPDDEAPGSPWVVTL
ncbi:MAG TPA: hypothetical protein VGH54_05495 [Mycobacterium sp.]|jgi:hypothetical protein